MSAWSRTTLNLARLPMHPHVVSSHHLTHDPAEAGVMDLSLMLQAYARPVDHQGCWHSDGDVWHASKCTDPDGHREHNHVHTRA